MFERFLDPDKRAQIGAHYTDPEKIMMIVEPVVTRPLLHEWQTAKSRIEAIMAPVLAASGGSGKAASRDLGKRFDAARAKAEAERDLFIDRLCALRILDPACGSGNFLYLALQAVKDIEYRAILECETLGLGMIVPRVGPEILHGIEINPFAAELARTTIWIGDIQWRVKNAITHHPRPILRKLDTIKCCDALLTPDGKGGFVEAKWPEADYIVGNPPFLGGKLLRRGLGDAHIEALFRTFSGRVPAEADLVCYWFAKAWAALLAGKAKRVGLVSTNSIRGGPNRKALEPLAQAGAIFEAWSDEAWTVEGAAVRVSLVCFGERASTASGTEKTLLNGKTVINANADLSGGLGDLTLAKPLHENLGIAFQGVTKGGPFEVSDKVARAWLVEPLNPNGKPNFMLLHPIISGGDIVKRREPGWVADFSLLTLKEAALYEEPFEHAKSNVEPFRANNRRQLYREKWWRFAESRPTLMRKINCVSRYIAAPKVSQHRLFSWIDSVIYPDNLVIAITRDDDCTFGVLCSIFHSEWSLRLGSTLEDRPDLYAWFVFRNVPLPRGPDAEPSCRRLR